MTDWQTLIDGDGCLVAYLPDYLDVAMVDADGLEKECLATEPFQPMLKFKTVEVPQPRLITWMADDPALTYTYTGVYLEPKPMTPRTRLISENLEVLLGVKFPTCLLNLYRDGNDSVGWHADNEKELGKGCTIAAISIGETRTFELRNRKKEIIRQELAPGSLVVMAGQTQQKWSHGVPKEPARTGRRISLTFRPHVKAKP